MGVWSYRKHNLYHVNDCTRKFLSSLKNPTTNILNFEKKRLPLTKQQLKLDQNTRNCYIYGKIILEGLAKNKHHLQAWDHCHYTGKYGGAAHSICI